MTNLGYTPEEPIAALATALAPGAIGIVRTSGRGCLRLVGALFSRPAALEQAAGNSLVHGWIVHPESGERIDEVVLGVYRAPRSYTGEDMVEIFCHGGIAVVQAVLRLLVRHGFRQAERGEFTFRAYINGKTDLTRAEAVREIIESRTDASRGHAAGRLAGTLRAELDGITRLLVDTLAAIEVQVEYPEDEETIAESFDGQGLRQAERRLRVLVDSWKSEKLYQDGARVVLCGRTNAGKSSLFNALLKEERALVSAAAGTTRDWLESWVSFDGIPARLFDTAGLRQSDDAVEAAGVALARDLTADADVLLYVVDAAVGLAADDVRFLQEPRTVPLVLVWNKCDVAGGLQSGAPSAQEAPSTATLQSGAVSATAAGGLQSRPLSAQEAAAAATLQSGAPSAQEAPAAAALQSGAVIASGARQSSLQSGTVPATAAGGLQSRAPSAQAAPTLQTATPSAEAAVSAKTGAGLGDLVAAVAALLSAAAPADRPQAGLGSARQKAAVAEALERVTHALTAAQERYALDAVVQDIEDALDALGQVTGAVTPEDVLDSVFAQFCVGK